MFRQIANTNLGRQLRSSAAVGGGGLRPMDHYKNPRNVGEFDNNDPNVGAPACGDVMKLQIRVDEAKRKIYESLFESFRCSSAAISLTPRLMKWAECMKGRPIEEVIKNWEIAEHVSLDCSMLAEDAIEAAVKDYDAKRTKVNGSQEAAPVEKAVDA